MDSMLRDIRKALQRLESGTTYLKRRNALLAFDRAVKALRTAVQEKYPKLRRDGSTIKRCRRKGVVCPACRVPMKSYIMLVRHLWEKHQIGYGGECFCGKRGMSAKRLAHHLAGQKDLRVHYGLSVLKKSAGVK